MSKPGSLLGQERENNYIGNCKCAGVFFLFLSKLLGSHIFKQSPSRQLSDDSFACVSDWRNNAACVSDWRNNAAGVSDWRNNAACVSDWRNNAAGVSDWRNNAACVSDWQNNAA